MKVSALQRTTGSSHPLGATVVASGANFSLFSRSATRVDLLCFDRADDTRPSRVIELDPGAQRTYVLSGNQAMLGVFAGSGLPMKQKRDGTVVQVTLSLAETSL